MTCKTQEMDLTEQPIADHDHSPVVTFPSTSVSESEKGLLQYFVAYHVLQNLGFRQERIEQCLLQGIKEGEGWEEALEWVCLISKRLSLLTIVSDVVASQRG